VGHKLQDLNAAYAQSEWDDQIEREQEQRKKEHRSADLKRKYDAALQVKRMQG